MKNRNLDVKEASDVFSEFPQERLPVMAGRPKWKSDGNRLRSETMSLRTKSGTVLHVLAAMLLLFIAASAMTHGTIEAQTVNWVEMGSPSARCCMGMAYDPATNTSVLFSGSNGGADTWIWHGGWFPMSPATSPPERSNSGLVSDGTGNMVLFGGTTSTGNFLNDTWTWDGTTWTQQSPPVSPSPRSQMAMAYDPATSSVVLFGGCNISPGACKLGDTWTWNGVAKTWTQQNPIVSPSARRAPMAYDNANGTMLLFGGDNAVGVQYTDSWNWNGTNWVQVFPASIPTPARNSANMTYDATLGAILLFGGCAGDWENSLNDTWIWNGNAWRQIHPATVPHNRYDFGMVYNPEYKALLMFGGFSSGPALSDTWLLALRP